MDQSSQKHDLNELTTLLADNIMLFHDNADYVGLEKNTAKIVRGIGHGEDVATECARLVRDIYIQYDIAQGLHERGNEGEERIHYSIAQSLANQLNTLLDSGYRTNNLVNMVYYWRHKRKALAILAILRDWMEKLGLRNIPFATYCTYLQVRAGYNHDKRDREEFEKCLGQLWSIVAVAKRGEKLPILF